MTSCADHFKYSVSIKTKTFWTYHFLTSITWSRFYGFDLSLKVRHPVVELHHVHFSSKINTDFPKEKFFFRKIISCAEERSKKLKFLSH